MTKEQLLTGIDIPEEITIDFIRSTFDTIWVDTNNLEHSLYIERCSREMDGRNSTLEAIFNDRIQLLITE